MEFFYDVYINGQWYMSFDTYEEAASFANSSTCYGKTVNIEKVEKYEYRNNDFERQ